MSSSVYWAELDCDEALRFVVLASGVAAALIGVALVASLPVHPSVRVVACCAWLLLNGLALYRIRRAYARFRGLRLADSGDAWLRDRNGQWHRAELEPGSVVSRRFGWLRLTVDDGTRYAEPLRGHCRHSAAWRRLHVIWRHVGAMKVSC